MDATQHTRCYLSCSHQAFIEKILNLDEAKRYRLITCGEGKLFACTPYLLDTRYLLKMSYTEAHLAYNRVALTEYFQHRSVEKLYLNQGGSYIRRAVSSSSKYLNSGVVCSAGP